MSKLRQNIQAFKIFIVPLLILGIFQKELFLIFAISIGILKIVTNSYTNIRARRYSLDYIAFAAMIISLISGELIAGVIVALMFTGGEALESFASSKAYSALKKLSDNIPKSCLVRTGNEYKEIPIQKIKHGDNIIVKNNELIPLDGTIESTNEALINLANLTGESEIFTFKFGTLLKSGSINIGETIELKVVGDFSSSTYHKIVSLVEQAKINPAQIVRLSEKANFYFTAITFIIAFCAYFLTTDITRLLAILVIATPCPLIIAGPVAFVSGMSRAANKGIILRKPSAFEGIYQSSTFFFDKTGTLTLGEPTLSEIQIIESATNLDENEILAIASGMEIHSLHPLARAITNESNKRKINYKIAEKINEQIGQGIQGTLSGKNYELKQSTETGEGITLSMFENKKEIAKFIFTESLKEGAYDLLNSIKASGIKTAILTGDKKENAEKILGSLKIEIFADLSPEDKYNLVDKAQKEKEVVVMIGDGLNDAPALARSNVSIVFSGTTNASSIEASDIAILGHGIEKLKELFNISNKTINIAKQSIYGGIILSVIGMGFAGFGFITPIYGAFIQEAIDVTVILNALRVLRV
jgi:heavy metal translocating P-type ATPase